MVKAKPAESSSGPGERTSNSSRKRSLRGGVVTDSDQDICHDFADDILETSRDSIEVADEISINPTDFEEKITRSPKDAHLKPERWKYKTRKKRKKSSEEASNQILDDESEKRVEDQVVECSSVENSVDLDLEIVKTKYAKMSKTGKQSDYGKKLYNILNCKNKSRGLDSAGNSEHQSSSDDAKRKPIKNWKDKTATAECEVCGKEMLRSRLRKHVKIAHKSKKLYPCDECSFNAENLIELKKHLRKRHKLSIGTVKKMVKLMKINRKHRRSVLEDDMEDIPLARRRLLSTHSGPTIQDELHQTDSGSELERRTRGVNRTNYKELSFDDEDWKLALEGTEDELKNADTDTEDEEDEDSMEEDKEDLEVAKEESADSGRETQTATELSSDEKTSEELAGEELLSTMRTLAVEERAVKGERFYSKQQRELLWSYFNINQWPTTEHREILGQKVGVDQRKVYFWFDNTRRIGKNKIVKAPVAAPVTIVEREKRTRKPRATTPEFLASRVVSEATLKAAGTVVEYDVNKITLSSRTLEEVEQAGEAVCIGVDITSTNCRCLLCNYTCSFRGNLYKHLRAHGLEPKFCALPREKSTLNSEMKGCRKTFTIESFDFHTCNDEPPQCFGEEVKLDKRYKTGITNSSNSSGESDQEDEGGIEVVENLRKTGAAVCLGYEVSDGCSKCCLCEVSAANRCNLYKHINSHGYSIKFCSAPRDNSDLEDGARGCRKIFLEETFDAHKCTDETPEQLGNFPLDRKQKSKKKVKRGGGGGGFRGFEKNFGTPDGSPAKFYNDRYTRLYHQLAIRTNVGLAMDSTFVRNGKMELCYLTDRQMTAVRDYLDDNDKYILVRLMGYKGIFCHSFLHNNIIKSNIIVAGLNLNFRINFTQFRNLPWFPYAQSVLVPRLAILWERPRTW